MITVDNFKKVLESLGFANENNIYTKHFETVDCDLKADFAKQKLIYPTEKGLEVNDGTTSNFAHPENFVVNVLPGFYKKATDLNILNLSLAGVLVMAEKAVRQTSA